MTNNVTIDGRLVEDPALRFTSSGKAVAGFRLAHTDRVKDASGQWVDGETIWDRVTVWGKDAETCAETMRKGDLILVAGRRKNNPYEKDGQKRDSVEIVAESVALMRKKGQGSGTVAAASQGYAPADPWASDAGPVPF